MSTGNCRAQKSVILTYQNSFDRHFNSSFWTDVVNTALLMKGTFQTFIWWVVLITKTHFPLDKGGNHPPYRVAVQFLKCKFRSWICTPWPQLSISRSEPSGSFCGIRPLGSKRGVVYNHDSRTTPVKIPSDPSDSTSLPLNYFNINFKIKQCSMTSSE